MLVIRLLLLQIMRVKGEHLHLSKKTWGSQFESLNPELKIQQTVFTDRAPSERLFTAGGYLLYVCLGLGVGVYGGYKYELRICSVESTSHSACHIPDQLDPETYMYTQSPCNI